MALAASSFNAKQEYSEKEVNDHLVDWLKGFTYPTGLDHVTVRRYLVDLKFLLRNPSGSSYWTNEAVIASVLELEARTIHPRDVLAEVQRQREKRKRSNASTSIEELVGFALNRPGYAVKLLKPRDAAVLQNLYEQCTEFSLLTDGQPPSPMAARDEFDAVPDGKTTKDKYILGLFNRQDVLIGMIESIRHYPDNQTWWLGLMMLSPQQRGQGLGSEFYQAFENWVSAQGVKQVSLSVVEANELGLQSWKSLGFEVIRKTEPRQFGNKIHAVYVMSRPVAATA